MRRFLSMKCIVFCVSLLLFISLIPTAFNAMEDISNKWEDNSVALSFTYRDIAVDDHGTYVVVGNNGKIQTSTNRVDWSYASSVTRKALFGCAWGNDVFVAVGSYAIACSNDGNEWTQVLDNEDIIFNDVAYGDYGFVVVGTKPDLNSKDDILYLYHSIDGVNWEEVLVYEGSFDWRKIDYLNNTYIAYNNLDGEFAYSKDGINWSVVKPSTTIKNAGLIWDGSRYIAIGSDMIYNPEDRSFTTVPYICTSENLIDWEQIDHNINDGVFLCDIVYYDGKYIMICSVDNGILLLSSEDFDYWEVYIDQYFGSLNGFIVDDNMLTFVGNNGAVVNVTEDGWKSTRSYNSHITKVVHGDYYLATGHDGRFYKSQDGKTWVQYSSGIESTVRDIVWTGEKYVVLRKVYDSETKICVKSQIFSSVDGEQWLLEDEIDNKNISSLHYLNNRYFTLGTKGEIFWSLNTQDWKQAETPNDKWLNDIEWFKGKYYAVGMFGTMLVSEDGISWEDHSFAYTDDLNDIATNGDTLQIVGDWMRSYNTKDGENWSKNPEHDSINFEKVIWDGSDYVIFAYGGKYYKTKDGISLREFETNMYSDVTTVCWSGMRYIVAGKDGAITSHVPTEFIKVVVDDKPITLTVAPQKINDVIMVPVEAVFEATGAMVYRNNQRNSVYIIKNGIVLEVQFDNITAFVNGTKKSMVTTAVNVEGEILVPLEFVAKELGMMFQWVEKTNTVIIHQ